jgi:hypothetical protein
MLRHEGIRDLRVKAMSVTLTAAPHSYMRWGTSGRGDDKYKV